VEKMKKRIGGEYPKTWKEQMNEDGTCLHTFGGDVL